MNQDEWVIIQQMLGRAKLILEEIAMPQHGLNPRTRSHITNVKAELNNVQINKEIKQAAENVEYQELLEKLEAEDKRISNEVYKGSGEFLK